MKLNGLLVPEAEVSAGQREAMFALMTQHYANVARATFLADLAEKQWVIMLLEPGSGTLCGFSTQMLLEASVEGVPVTALFSGDTIIAPEYWGDVALTHVWGQLALSLIDRHPAGRLYWFLISKGYKTYRFLPVFFHEFYPRHDVPMPASVRRVRDVFGAGKFPGIYDAAAGVIRAAGMKDHLRPGVADVTPERLRDAHVRFFLEQNPGYQRGEELCCIAPLSRENFTPAAYRVIEAKATRRVG